MLTRIVHSVSPTSRATTRIVGEAAVPYDSLPKLAPPPTNVAPLVRLLQASTSMPTRLTVTVSDGENTWTQRTPSMERDHEMVLLGFRPARMHRIDVSATDADGTEYGTAPTLTWT
jgi:hypothetical protein